VPPGRTSRIAAELKTLPRQFWLLAAGTFVYLIGVEMCYPFETIYMRDVLGVSVTAIGLIVGITMFATLPMQVVGGALCDRYGRRPVLAVGITGSMTLYIGLGLTHQLWLVVALIAFEAAFGWAQFITASNAMIADLTPLPRRAEAFSISRVALNAGITLGPLAAAPLIALDPTFRLPFLAAGAVCALCLIFVLALLRETRPPETRRLSVAAAFSGYGLVLRDRRMVAFCLVALLPLFGFGQIWVTMPIMLGDLHGVSAQQWALLMVVYGVAMATLQYPVIRLFGKYDHMWLMSLSALFIGAGMGVAAFVPYPVTYACMFLICLGIVLLIPISATVVSNLSPADLRGRYMGMWTLVYMGGYALGPLLGGWALARLGGRGAFAVIAAAGLLGAALFPLLRRSGTGRARAEETAGPPEPLLGELRGERPEQAL
jgi:MFS family permease